MMPRPTLELAAALIAAVGVSPHAAAHAGPPPTHQPAARVAGAARACGPDAPTGFYQGSVVSAKIGELDVALNLRCAAGDFAGALITPVGTFLLRGGSYRTPRLVLRLDVRADRGVLTGSVVRDGLIASFSLPGDSGPVVLRRVGAARPEDVPTPTLALTPAQWREDVAAFARQLPAPHANAFAHYPRADFTRDIAGLEHALDRLDPDQVYVRLDAIANRIGDGHTFVALPGDAPVFPFVLKRFGGGYRVTAAAPAYARALGMRLVRVGEADAATARERLLALTPAGETMTLRDARVEDFLASGTMLHGLGLVADESFWFSYLPDASLVYCNWRGYADLAKRGAALLALIDSVRPRKLLIDMRQNGGGDFTLGLRHVIEPIARRWWLDAPDRLFVAIGANTFSAGMANAAQFRSRTRATLVGTSIGERPNSYQEPRAMHLPNSWLTVRYSTRLYRFVDSGPNEVRPDVEIPTSWSDYRAGRDPVLNWVVRR